MDSGSARLMENMISRKSCSALARSDVTVDTSFCNYSLFWSDCASQVFCVPYAFDGGRIVVSKTKKKPGVASYDFDVGVDNKSVSCSLRNWR